MKKLIPVFLIVIVATITLYQQALPQLGQAGRGGGDDHGRSWYAFLHYVAQQPATTSTGPVQPLSDDEKTLLKAGAFSDVEINGGIATTTLHTVANLEKLYRAQKYALDDAKAQLKTFIDARNNITKVDITSLSDTDLLTWAKSLRSLDQMYKPLVIVANGKVTTAHDTFLQAVQASTPASIQREILGRSIGAMPVQPQ